MNNSASKPFISFDNRMVIHAAIDALMASGEPYPASKARTIIQLVPLTKRRIFQLDGHYTSAAGSIEAEAVGGGSATAEVDGMKKSFSVGRNGALRIGQWRVHHQIGSIHISKMMSEPDDDGTFVLIYDRLSGILGDMLKPSYRYIQFGRCEIRFNWGFDVWKTPDDRLAARS